MHRLVLSNCSPFLIVNAAVAEELNSSAPWSWLKLWSWMSQSPVSISEICFCFNMSSTISQSAHECSMCSMCTMCTVYNLLQNLWVFYGSSRCGPLPRWFGNHWIMDPKPNCYLYNYQYFAVSIVKRSDKQKLGQKVESARKTVRDRFWAVFDLSRSIPAARLSLIAGAYRT